MAENLVFNIKGNSKSLEDSIKRTQAQMKNLQRTVDNIGRMAGSTAQTAKGFTNLGSEAFRAKRPIQDISRINFRKLNANVDQLTRRLNSAKVFGNRLITAMAGVGTTIVLFRTATHSVVRFEKAMGEVAAITNATAENFKMLQAEAMRLGATTMFSGEQAAQGLKFLAMAGLSAEEATKALQGTLNLAQAGAMNLGDAADIASNIMTAFRKEASELGDIVDDLATIASSSNTSIQQLGDAMKYVSASAAAFGMSLPEVNAAIGVLSNAGMQASMAGTGLRQVLVRLSGQSAAMRQGMAALGITFAEINPEVNSLIEIVDRFARTNITASQITSMFGARAANAFANLLAGRDSLVELTEAQANNTGRAQEMADVMGNTLFGSLKKVQSAYEAFFQTLFNSEGVAQGIQGALGDLANLINYFSGSLQVFDGSPLEEFSDSVSETYAETAKLAETIKDVVDVAIKFAVVLGSLAVIKTIVPAVALLSNGFGKLTTKLTEASVAKSKLATQATVMAARLDNMNLRLKRTAASTGLFNASLIKVRAGANSLVGSVVRARNAITGFSIKSTLAGVSLTKLRASLFATGAASRVTSSAIQALGSAKLFAASASKVLATSMRVLKVAIGTLVPQLGVLYLAFEAIQLIWPNIFGGGDVEKATRDLTTLQDQVKELEKAVNSAELKIDMEVGADGIIRAKKELTDLQKDTGIEVVPFKELKNMEQLGVLIGVTETKLNDARKQARGLQGELRFAKANNESRETIENIRQMIRDNSDLQDSLESNLAFIKANGQAYVEQVQSVEALRGATKVLTDTIKDMETASAAAGATMKGQLENVEGTIDQIKMKIGQLTNAETTRAQTGATATQDLIEKERELQELRERGAKKSEIARAKGAVGVAQVELDAAKSGTKSTGLGGMGGTRVRDEMTTQAQNALNAEIGTLRDALKNFEVTGKFDDADVFTKINDSFQRLKDAGIKGIEVDINASDEAIAKQIQTIEELITLTNQLNNQKKLRNAMEKQITAEIEGRSTDVYEKEISAIQKLIKLEEQRAKQRADAKNYEKGGERSIAITKGGEDVSTSIALPSLDFEKNRATIQEGFKTISDEYKKQKIKLVAEIDAQIADLEDKMAKERLGAEKIVLQNKIEGLKQDRANVSGFGSTENTSGSADKTQELLDSLKSAFSGLGDFDSVIAKFQQELDSTDFNTAAEGARAAFENKLLELADKFANMQGPDEQIETKIAVALTNSANATAERMASEIAVVGEQQKQINLIRQQNELMLIQAKLRENIAAQAELAQAGPGLVGGAENEAADKQAQQAFDAKMDALKNEQAAIEGDMGVVTAEIQAANQAIADAISDLEDRLKTEIKAIREGDGNEDEKAKAEAEAKARAEKDMLKAGRVAGEQAGDDAAVKQNLKDAERANAEEAKLAKQKTDEEKKAIAAKEKADKKREQEALAIAKDLAGVDEATKGTSGISSMAAIGGGGGVGVGGNIPQQQLDVQKKAADILEKMLDVLAVPEEFGGDQDRALNELMGKLTNEEKKVAIAGFENLMNAAQQEGVNDEQREALKAQAMDLLNGLAEQAANRNFNPEGGGLPQALFDLPVVNGQNGMPVDENNPLDRQNQIEDDPIVMIKKTNDVLAEISKKLDKSVVLGQVDVIGGGMNA